jgi:TNF receptor-associated protein 1
MFQHLKTKRFLSLLVSSSTKTHPATSATTAARFSSAAMLSRQMSFMACRSLPSIVNRSYSITPRLLNSQNYEFQAETRKLLDIVTHSIYTDKEVFLRELVSNASDSLEKLRYLQTTGNTPALSDDTPLEINIDVDVEKKILTISDNGIGMTKDELISNLGTIARSGSKQFVEKIQNTTAGSSRDGDGIIGQFGVGFYSSFMVSDRVTVESLSADSADKVAHSWESDGSGTFTVNEVTAARGSKLTLHLKDTCSDFCDPKRIKEIVKKYSNFVAFPIKVDGVVVNTVTAIWTQDKNSVTEQQYNDFYKYVANAFDKPKYVLHFKADAPLDLKALLFFPTLHTEKFGMGRMEPGEGSLPPDLVSPHLSCPHIRC